MLHGGFGGDGAGVVVRGGFGVAGEEDVGVVVVFVDVGGDHGAEEEVGGEDGECLFVHLSVLVR